MGADCRRRRIGCYERKEDQVKDTALTGSPGTPGSRRWIDGRRARARPCSGREGGPGGLDGRSTSVFNGSDLGIACRRGGAGTLSDLPTLGGARWQAALGRSVNASRAIASQEGPCLVKGGTQGAELFAGVDRESDLVRWTRRVASRNPEQGYSGDPPARAQKSCSQ
jgi:hypothetical protein